MTKKKTPETDPGEDRFEVLVPNLELARKPLEVGSIHTRSEFAGCNVEALVASRMIKPAK